MVFFLRQKNTHTPFYTQEQEQQQHTTQNTQNTQTTSSSLSSFCLCPIWWRSPAFWFSQFHALYYFLFKTKMYYYRLQTINNVYMIILLYYSNCVIMQSNYFAKTFCTTFILVVWYYCLFILYLHIIILKNAEKESNQSKQIDNSRMM